MGKYINYEKFVRTWLSSKTLDEVREKTGYPNPAAIAFKLRKNGVNLPRFKRANPIDVERLNLIIIEAQE